MDAAGASRTSGDAVQPPASVWCDAGRVEVWGSAVVQSYPHFADIQLGFKVQDPDGKSEHSKKL